MNSKERGECCFCQGDCNPNSQSCGICARTLTGYSLGWNTLPPYLFPENIQERQINSIINSININKNSVIVYDIDDTLLDKFSLPISHIVNTYNYAKSKGLIPIIITARPDTEESITTTIKQLDMANIKNYMSIYFRPQDNKDVYRYKLLSRKNIHDKGYKVEMSIGDLKWDVGDYGGISYIV